MSLYYQDDSVTLYHGDCLAEHREWLDADVLVTDPPYGVRWKQSFGDRRKRSSITEVRDAIQGDDSTDARDGVLQVWGKRPAMVFGTWRIERPRQVRSLLIWHKAGAFSGPLNAAFFTNHEEIYVLGDGWPKSSDPLRSVITTNEVRHHEPRKNGHPTSKPVGLMEALIATCPPGIIADPFAGSGSTLVAAKAIGRRAIGIELEERYCEVAANRLCQGVLDLGALA